MQNNTNLMSGWRRKESSLRDRWMLIWGEAFWDKLQHFPICQILFSSSRSVCGLPCQKHFQSAVTLDYIKPEISPPPETTAPCKIHTKKRVPGWFHHRWGTNSCLLPEMLTFSHSQDNGTVVTRRHHTEDTYIGIRSLVCTRALESDKLVAALVHHETADWNAKKRRNITQDSWLLAHADPTAAINNNCAEFLGHSSEAALGKVENWRQIHTQVCWFKGHKRKRGHQWELHNLVWRQDLKKSNVSTRNGLYGKSLMLVQYEMGQWEMLQRRAEQLRSVDVARHHVINTGVSKMWGWFCPRQR